MITKICSVCKKEKDLSEFSRKCKDSDKLLSRCKECASIAYGKWRLKNLERRKENKKEWYENNIEHVKQYDKEHKNTDEYKEIKRKCDKKYYEKNKDKVLQTCKTYSNNHKIERKLRDIDNAEKIKERTKKWRQDNPDSAKRSKAKRKRNLGFNPLNEKSPNSVAHHIDRVNILYIPEELHKSIPHKQGEVSMNNINQASLEWYFTQNTIVNRPNLEGDVF